MLDESLAKGILNKTVFKVHTKSVVFTGEPIAFDQTWLKLVNHTYESASQVNHRSEWLLKKEDIVYICTDYEATTIDETKEKLNNLISSSPDSPPDDKTGIETEESDSLQQWLDEPWDLSGDLESEYENLEFDEDYELEELLKLFPIDDHLLELLDSGDLLVFDGNKWTELADSDFADNPQLMDLLDEIREFEDPDGEPETNSDPAKPEDSNDWWMNRARSLGHSWNIFGKPDATNPNKSDVNKDENQ